MKMLTSIPVLILLAANTAAAPVKVDGRGESWVHVLTEKNRWNMRIDGGPLTQDKGEFRRDPNEKKWKPVPDSRSRAYGYLFGDGKRMIYAEEDPESKKHGAKFDRWRHRVMIADADGKNPKQVFTGLKWNELFRVSADEKSMVCGADQGGKWDIYRIPFDGSPPIKISDVSGLGHPAYRVLPDGRILYLPVIAWHSEKAQIGTWTIGKGPVILTDGKKEMTLLKESLGILPAMTNDAQLMARSGTNESGVQVVEVTELKSGKESQFPLRAFNKDWTCQFGELKFRPDGKAILVNFSLGPVVIREKGPLPGDEAVQHFGVIWLDGRREQTSLFKIDEPRKEFGYYPEIRQIEWSSAPKSEK